MLRAAVVLLVVFVSTFAQAGTVVRVSTSVGYFSVELYDAITWRTVQNFLGYVNRGDYNQTYLHRTVAPESGGIGIIQGGGFRFQPFVGPVPVPTQPPVLNEPVFSNVRGTIAMAKLFGDPDSATSQWFFNYSDNSESLDVSNQGFTVFGEVMGGEDGMEVLDAIAVLQKVDLGPRASLAPIVVPFYDNNPLDFVYVSMEVVDRFSTAVNMYSPPQGIILSSVDVNAGEVAYSVNFSVVSDNTIQAKPGSVVTLTEAPEGAATFSSADNRLRFPEIEANGNTVYRNVVFVLSDEANLRFTLESFEQ